MFGCRSQNYFIQTICLQDVCVSIRIHCLSTRCDELRMERCYLGGVKILQLIQCKIFQKLLNGVILYCFCNISFLFYFVLFCVCLIFLFSFLFLSLLFVCFVLCFGETNVSYCILHEFLYMVFRHDMGGYDIKAYGTYGMKHT